MACLLQHSFVAAEGQARIRKKIARVPGRRIRHQAFCRYGVVRWSDRTNDKLTCGLGFALARADRGVGSVGSGLQLTAAGWVGLGLRSAFTSPSPSPSTTTSTSTTMSTW